MFSICLFYLNYLFPYFPGDDFYYQLAFPEDGPIGDRAIDSIGSFCSSIINHYNNYNPRVLPHATLQAILLLSKVVFDLINTFAFLFLAYVIMTFSQVRNWYKKLYLFCFTLFFIWVFHFALGRAYFWTTGSLNYTWFLSLQLLYLRGLLRAVESDNDISIRTVFLSLLVCTTNENVILALFVASVIVIFYHYIVEQRISKKIIIAGFILGAGGAIMLVSPSMQLRVEAEASIFVDSSDKIIEYCKRQLYYILCMLPIALYYSISSSVSFINKRSLNLIILVLVVANLTMIFAPLYRPRSAVFSFIAMICLVLKTTKFEIIKRQWLITPLILIAGLMAYTRLPLYKKVHDISKINYDRLEANRNSSDTVYVDKICYSYRYDCMMCDDFSDDTTLKGNEAVESFYNINKIAIDPKYSVSLRRQHFINNHTSLNNYSINHIDDNTTLYLKDFNDGLEVIVEYREMIVPEDHLVILRGSRSGLNSHRFIDILPSWIRMYFLDYKEHQESLFRLRGKFYSYNFIFDPDDYNYFVASLYSKKNHRAVKSPFIIEID